MRQLWVTVCLPLMAISLLPAVAEARCPRNCRRCETPFRCTACKPGRQLVVLHTGRQTCARLKHHVRRVNHSSTTVCDPNCDSKTGCRRRGARFCDSKCVLGYGLTPTHTCVACDRNCATKVGCSVNGGGFCDGSCIVGYGPTSTHTCVACDRNCAPSVGCTLYGGGFCDGNCTTGYGPTPSHTCVACDEFCDTNDGCNERGGGFCDRSCTSGYGLTSSFTCTACDKNCASNVGCTLYGGGFCDGNCTTGYGPTPSHTCAACDLHCDDNGCNQYGGQFCDVGCVSGYQLTSAHTCEPVGCGPASCPLNIDAYFGVISSPNYPNAYNPNSNDQWIISCPDPTQIIILDFSDFSTEDNNDYVNVYDGSDGSGNLIGQFSGQFLPPPRGVNSSGPHMYIQLTSDDSYQFRGFLAVFHTQSA